LRSSRSRQIFDSASSRTGGCTEALVRFVDDARKLATSCAGASAARPLRWRLEPYHPRQRCRPG
jgi:hypothetical protein